MKRIIVVITVAVALLTASSSKAQISLNLGINIGSQPVWGPVGYDYVDYYYLPDIEAYYSVPKHQYVYLSGSSWVFSNNLPPRYANYDLYKGYKVVVNEPRPYSHFANHRVEYGKYKAYKAHQEYIKESNDPKYYVVKGHPKFSSNNKNGDKHDGTLGHQNNGNGNKGKGKGKGRDHH